ncbi:MAG TPA: discoidin domain-containing protein, partial [Pilimelia sp.]|nr:discoidin domain-containing protein [Pilimelia sp.]
GASFSAVDYGQLGTPANPCGDPPGGAMTPPTAEGGALRSQDVLTGTDPTGLDGTILRLDATTGAAAAGNPLISSADLNTRRIVAHGTRNPFRFAFRPGTDELWFGDVGWNVWEEVNRLPSPASSVRNYGWPCYEGTGRQSGYDSANLNLCEGLYAGAGQTGPHYAYNHSAKVVAGETCPSGGSSNSGVAFHPSSGGSYPAAYRGAMFFADYSRDCIWAMLPTTAGGVPDPANILTFGAAAGNPVDLATGPGGDLYYADAGGFVRRIRYFPNNRPPTAVLQANPTSGTPPLTVAFDARSSSDPDPADAGLLRYEWDFTSDGTVDATTPTASHTYPAGGPYTARLRVVDSAGAEDVETVAIQTGNTAPTAVIDTPAASLTFAVGDTISFSGHATDPQQGNLPASALRWQLIQHHCTTATACHEHLVRTWDGVASGSFPAPDHEYPSHLELTLTATDAGGLTHVSSRRLNPKTVALTFASNPAGLQLAVGSAAGTAPFTRTVIQGSANSVSAVTPQTVGGTTYVFSSWSDGGAQTHVITAPSTPTTYTATFTGTSAVQRLPQSQLSVRSVSSQETFLVNGRGANMLDGNASTVWSSRLLPTAAMPHEVQLDLGASHNVSRLYYLARQSSGGRIAAYEVYVSADGVTWGSPVATGTFADVATEQTVSFPAKPGRYLRLRALSATGGGPWATIAELNVGVTAPAR